MSDKIRFFSLGGLDESGKNISVLEINGDIFIIDCGMKYPDNNIPGVDLIIPNIDYLLERKDRIKGYLITHGHDDVMGALPYIYKKLPAPVYCSEITHQILLTLIRGYGLSNPNIEFHIVNGFSKIKIANREVQFLPVPHSIPGSFAIAIYTDQGYIFYSSEYILDFCGPYGHSIDLKPLTDLGTKGVLMLMTDSHSADKSGFTAPKHRITPLIQGLFTDPPGRIFISVYTQNMFNLEEIIDLSIKCNKKIVFYSKAAENVANNLIYRDKPNYIPRENKADFDDLARLREKDVVVIITGFGAQLFHRLIGISSGSIGPESQKHIEFNENDTFVLACPSVPGTETIAIEATDNIYKTGAHVIQFSRSDIYSMHPREEDLKMLINVLKPKYYVPIKGDFCHLMANAKIALSMNMGYSHNNIFVLDNGMSLSFNDGKPKPDFVNLIPNGDILVDGTDVSYLKTNVIEERQKMANDGVIVLASTVSSKTHNILTQSDIQMRGFIFLKDQEHVVKEISNIFNDQVQVYLTGYYASPDEVCKNTMDRILRYVRKETGKNPLVIPKIIDVDYKA